MWPQERQFVAHFRVTSALQATFDEIQYSSLEPTATSQPCLLHGRKPQEILSKNSTQEVPCWSNQNCCWENTENREKHISCQPLLAEDVHIEETRPVPSRMWKLCLRGRAWSPLKANGNQHFATLLRRTLQVFPWFVDPLVGEIVGVLWSDLWTVYICLPI